jgi:hypothetical protein
LIAFGYHIGILSLFSLVVRFKRALVIKHDSGVMLEHHLAKYSVGLLAYFFASNKWS